jgi:uncharacterized protein involved in high-affinity Fe2+ transport
MIAGAAVILAAVVLVFTVFDGAPAKTRTYEGEGAESPEDALRAYLTAYRDMDMDAILSACAVESYAEHYDLEAFVRRMKMYNVSFINSGGVIIPNTDVRSQDLNTALVAARIYSNIYSSALNYAFHGASAAGTQYTAITFNDEREYEDFFDELTDTSKFESIQSLAIEKILTEKDLSRYGEGYSSESTRRVISNAEEMCGGALADIAAIVTIDGERYLFGVYAVEYDDSGKWYIIPNGGSFTVFCGVNPYYQIGGGPIPIDGEAMNSEAALWLSSFSDDDTDRKSVKNEKTSDAAVTVPPSKTFGAASPAPTAETPASGEAVPPPDEYMYVGFTEYPIGDDLQLGPLNVAGVYFQPVDMEPAGNSLPAAESDMHIEADISALPNNELGYGVGDFVSNLTVDYEIINEYGNVAAEGTFMPMNASDGPHYGANIRLGDAGTYKVRFIIKSPEEQGYLLHVDEMTGVTGRFWSEPLIAEWDFNYTPIEW